MRPFNLKEALAGKPIQTRDGRKARIIYTKLKSEYPIIAIITNKDGSEVIYTYTRKGQFFTVVDDANKKDLVMTSIKHEGWINLYREYTIIKSGIVIYNTEEDALREATYNNNYLKTIKIEWEE